MKFGKVIALEVLRVVVIFAIGLGLWQWYQGSFEGWADLLNSAGFFAFFYACFLTVFRLIGLKRDPE